MIWEQRGAARFAPRAPPAQRSPCCGSSRRVHAHKELQLGQRAARMGAEGPFSKQNVANVGTAKVAQVLGEFAGESPGLALSPGVAVMMLSTGEPLEKLVQGQVAQEMPCSGGFLLFLGTMAGKQRQIWGHLPFPWI